jgi:hypothetical protein
MTDRSYMSRISDGHLVLIYDSEDPYRCGLWRSTGDSVEDVRLNAWAHEQNAALRERMTPGRHIESLLLNLPPFPAAWRLPA